MASRNALQRSTKTYRRDAPVGANRTDEALTQKAAILEGIARLQRDFLVAADPRESFDTMLSFVLETSASEYGFIAEVHRRTNGQLFLKTHAITNIAWDEETRRFYEREAPVGLEFDNLKTLFGAVLTTGETVVSNDPSTDSRAGGRPAGHPDLNCFLGIPLFHSSDLIGMVGIANRINGYDDAIIEMLQPVQSTCASLVYSYQLERRRIKAEDDSRQYLEKLAHNARVNMVAELGAGLAHELNQPLTAIANYSSVAYSLAKKPDDCNPYLLSVLSDLNAQSLRTGEIVKSWRRFLKSDNVKRTRLNLNDLIGRVVKFLHPAIVKSRVIVILEFDQDSTAVEGDEVQLQQVVANLIGNSLDAMEDDAIENRELTISIKRLESSYVEVGVRDFGDGIATESMPQVFDTFFSTKNDGMGLGLPICRSIVNSHGGKIWATSNEMTGTTVRFTLKCSR